ncbi:hypothetical protein Molly5_64 [Maribacter phage Molly_5]|uniref:Uncharacterized protein n=2 Tax=Mollyvirus TaxID=2948826 RepID=A0A8E4XY11_9CAUD|nr:hypothetical protein M1M29_gp064 [Maribacter phage Molly_1]YP_010357311.1 hypothetical protein M1M30_gp062 [Maribacter phage Colly_1]QQO97749.1 hypothetical protein Molly2_64 [Maribacter phage Molly_2]QQO97949.1 hypothetical protein Molly3_64 [Maribacter phage Molly_3]QQO98149.1 hypothetical protein Molly4_64 [Maribacter phage Molly_4]QQO98349.1 hypothetical protein Molly5_64 [Maribacter phage Molly_5]QQO97347.1 hypothetical protein Colly1_62 [Maribacter phage Colly_1]
MVEILYAYFSLPLEIRVEDSLVNGGIIGAVVTLILAIIKLGDKYLSKYVDSKRDVDIKRLELQADSAEVAVLQNNYQEALNIIAELKSEKVDLESRLLVVADKERKTFTKLNSIIISFDIVYDQLERIFEPGDPNMALLKKYKYYIDK